MTDEELKALVARLRENAPAMPTTDRFNAADAIEALMVERDELYYANLTREMDLRERAERAEAALRECADDLEAELRARYEMGSDKKIYMQARFERDMQPVANARAVLAQIEKETGDE